MSELNEQAKQFAIDHHEALIELIKQLCAIPSFSNHEEQKAAFVCQWLKERGADSVYIDEAFNVVLPIGIEGKNKLAVFMAHLDTVFPDTTGFIAVEEEGRLKAPGVGDDTANLALLMLIADYVVKYQLTAEQGVLFVFNSGEEGLGNLKGCRQLMNDFKGRIQEVYSFDGSYTGMVNKAVGSVRYKVTLKTEGGHSYGSFGNRNAIACMASLINLLYSLKVPEGGKTTFNVGTIEGGTSVNTIAQSCTMLFEYRSDVKEHLDAMCSLFDSALETTRKMGITAEVKILGERPCMAELNEVRQEKIIAHAKELISRYTGNTALDLHSGSTDCNIPFAAGINALCFGGYIGKGAHTREEYIEIESLKPGFLILLNFVLDFFEN